MNNQEETRSLLIGNVVFTIILLVVVGIYIHFGGVVLSIIGFTVSTFFLIVQMKKIKSLILSWIKKYKSLSSLTYYNIRDNKKSEDIDERRKFSKEIRNTTIGVRLFIMIWIFSAWFFMNKMINNPIIMGVVTAIMAMAVLVYIAIFIWDFIHHFTSVAYTLIMFASLLMVGAVLEANGNISMVVYLSISLVITSGLYFLFVTILPMHYVRRIKGLTAFTVAIANVIPVFVACMVQYATNKYMTSEVNAKVTIEKIHTDYQQIFSDLKLIDLVKEFMLIKFNNEISTMIMTVTTFIVASYILGNLIVLYKIQKNKSKASLLYREMAITSTYDYKSIQKCCYYGGEEYENLMLADAEAKKIILEKEENIKIVDISSKTRFIKWVKRQKIVSDIREMKKMVVELRKSIIDSNQL